MGRKKSNARILPRGRKIHVNKYINKRGCTKHKSAATHNHSTEKQQESSHTTYDSFPAYNWPTTRIPKQYEIWFAELGNHYGTCVQSGNRPVLILTNDIANRYSQTFTVIPLTSKMKKLDLPTHIVLTEAHCEMLRAERLEDSILLVEQITTIDQSALFGRLCRVISAEKSRRLNRLWQGSLICTVLRKTNKIQTKMLCAAAMPITAATLYTAGRRSNRYGGYQKYPGGAEDLLPVLCLEI